MENGLDPLISAEAPQRIQSSVLSSRGALPVASPSILGGSENSISITSRNPHTKFLFRCRSRDGRILSAGTAADCQEFAAESGGYGPLPWRVHPPGVPAPRG